MKRGSIILAALFTPACFLPSFEKDQGGGGEGGGGSSGTGTCEIELATPPTAPADPNPGGEIEFFSAWHAVDVGESHMASRPGFDLDGVCACCDVCDTSTCAPPLGTTEEYCDAVEGEPNEGRDNNAAKFLLAIAELNTALTSQGMQQRTEIGTWSVIVRVSQYNGDPDDGQVNVALYSTTGSTASPEWADEDVWNIRQDSLAAGGTLDDALVQRDDAYVKDGVLVAKFEDAQLSLVLPVNFVVKLQHATFSSRIELADSGKYQLRDGVISGRWGITDAVPALAGMRTMTAPDAPVSCPGDLVTYPDYPSYKTALCNLRDEGTIAGPGPCDALSFGLAFTADPIDTPVVVPFNGASLCPTSESTCE
ncbi:MAG: hypothetical protein HOW73_00115 [Polyangiaceae bacterium]|nr:hypothetical protein [Polyangiaceae bacterium]